MRLIQFLFTLSLILVPKTLHAAPSSLEWELETNESATLGSLEPDLEFRQVKNAFEEGLEEYLKCPDGISILFWPVQREQLRAGRFPRMEIRFKDGSLQGIETLNVHRGRVSVYDLDFDLATLMETGKLKIQSIGDLKFRMQLNEQDINFFLAGNEERLRMNRPSVEFKDKRLFFKARVRTLFFNSRVKTEGRFVVNKEDQTVDFRAHHASLNSLPVPGFVLGNLLSRINPVLDLKSFPLVELMNLELDEVKIQSGWIELSGT